MLIIQIGINYFIKIIIDFKCILSTQRLTVLTDNEIQRKYVKGV